MPPLTLSNFGPLTMVDLPGGWFVMGSAKVPNVATPHWRFVDPFRMTPGPVAYRDGSWRSVDEFSLQLACRFGGATIVYVEDVGFRCVEAPAKK